MAAKSKKTNFLPDSVSGAVRGAAFRGAGLALLLIGLGLAIALIFHNPYLDGFAAASNFGRQSLIGNIIGFVGYGIGFIPALFVFLFAMRVGVAIMLKWENNAPEYDILRAFLAAVFGAFGLGAIMPSKSWGGLLGAIAAYDLSRLIPGFGVVFGIVFIAVFLFIAGVLLHVRWKDVRMLGAVVFKALKFFLNVLRLRPVAPREPDDEEEETEEEDGEEEKEVKRKSGKKKAKAAVVSGRRPTSTDYELPLPEYLEKSIFSKNIVTNELKRNASALEAHFEEFGVYGKVAGIKPGPIVTLYEFEPDSGMRIAKITDTVKDMTRAMAAENIRIAHIPRSNYIGVEMVNLNRQIVRFQSLITNPDFVNSRYHIPLALGVDIGGRPVYFDLAKMPHALIAGRTGSGKSVFVQSIIMSIVYHFTPDRCKLLIVDPKGVDFTLWQDIPHLITPVVADANMAVNALKWAVREMEDRYKKLKDLGAQNLEGYNEAVARLRANGEKLIKQVAVGTDPETGALEFEDREVDLSDMPYLVIIIDEVADLMSVARKEVEACVQRLAQKARAAGMHIVAATQRPDTSVITGVIKANFPTRISFQARSNIDSMTTLGEKGAEQLLPFGDMLFSEAGRVPVRIHGAWIENKEINKVADFLRAQGAPEYIDGIGDPDDESFGSAADSALAGIPGMPVSKDAKDADLYRQAVEYVVKDKKPTISYIQRRLGIGYNKAAGLIERMEREGIVSGPDANNKRHIL
ncbi:MAG: FtsK/SpoIIIE domain-containing protein [Alphaproteobacteria bacterium]|nr:FtsK/SpoIIIE domain-containing protein [Alphaproteobacteria bacterium]